MNKIQKAIRFFRRFGLKAFYFRIYAEFLKGRENQNRPQTNRSIEDINNLVTERFYALKPLIGFTTVGAPPRRINLVTDSINSNSLFGGVATSMILSTLLAERWGCDLRIITRTESPNRGNYAAVLEPNDISLPRNIDFTFAYFQNPQAEIPVGEGDIFLTTSWWTTWSVRETFTSQKIIYLLQEDERSFYPLGDDHLRCTEVMHDPQIRFCVNTHLLYDYLTQEGFDTLAKNGIFFEPAWPQKIFYPEPKNPKSKRNFFFYARPNHIRNLFYRGLEALNTAVNRGILNPLEWDFHFVGKDVPEARIGGQPVTLHQKLNWANYAALVRQMDLGLSLMYTPHPSYPPLDLAASGAIVVTNRFANKQNLDFYSKNIVCADLSVEGLVEGIREGIERANDEAGRLANYHHNNICRDWHQSFGSTLSWLERQKF
jgi:hypothetical protein